MQTVLQKPVLTFGRGTAPQVAVEAIVVTLAKRAGVPLAETKVTCMPSVAVIVKLLRDGYGIAAVPALFVEPFLRVASWGAIAGAATAAADRRCHVLPRRRRRRRAGGVTGGA